MAFNGTSINWGEIGKNGYAAPVVNAPFTVSKDSIDEIMKSIGNVLAFNNRRNALGSDPRLESMRSRLEQLTARRAQLSQELAMAEQEEAGLMEGRLNLHGGVDKALDDKAPSQTDTIDINAYNVFG